MPSSSASRASAITVPTGRSPRRMLPRTWSYALSVRLLREESVDALIGTCPAGRRTSRQRHLLGQEPLVDELAPQVGGNGRVEARDRCFELDERADTRKHAADRRLR